MTPFSSRLHADVLVRRPAEQRVALEVDRALAQRGADLGLGERVRVGQVLLGQARRRARRPSRA